ncbi:hypothetical protein L596_002692 [Steinernema carpocapsae]|uniref:Uncharacterized protein n=1 Tax=Steinernema carpocapsae TaxID=34508 RepID=A0A4U8UU12_STECR|nr:hypothetical protein L596_002692 [Steinernema carpocapsae]
MQYGRMPLVPGKVGETRVHLDGPFLRNSLLPLRFILLSLLETTPGVLPLQLRVNNVRWNVTNPAVPVPAANVPDLPDRHNDATTELPLFAY